MAQLVAIAWFEARQRLKQERRKARSPESVGVPAAGNPNDAPEQA